ncbi:uncharacterized protein GGS22DRAFT_85498 [Annulohypoxylon maeteangense]|uniref:uncharacterized protein n=1 Tax=Annulohypoxylon maeteangense TaxID=1927788 RepID=UPI002008D27A|nr:uncharacterized protein GGS22DRAFT_85498 [Annulohypoxylon maeteangense]KAI0880399.1 hypothetical protein GGS22DRAFT_85498 [Annulohypoxylon maeteangense]
MWLGFLAGCALTTTTITITNTTTTTTTATTPTPTPTASTSTSTSTSPGPRPYLLALLDYLKIDGPTSFCCKLLTRERKGHRRRAIYQSQSHPSPFPSPSPIPSIKSPSYHTTHTSRNRLLGTATVPSRPILQFRTSSSCIGQRAV